MENHHVPNDDNDNDDNDGNNARDHQMNRNHDVDAVAFRSFRGTDSGLDDSSRSRKSDDHSAASSFVEITRSDADEGNASAGRCHNNGQNLVTAALGAKEGKETNQNDNHHQEKTFVATTRTTKEEKRKKGEPSKISDSSKTLAPENPVHSSDTTSSSFLQEKDQPHNKGDCLHEPWAPPNATTIDKHHKARTGDTFVVQGKTNIRYHDINNNNSDSNNHLHFSALEDAAPLFHSAGSSETLMNDDDDEWELLPLTEPSGSTVNLEMMMENAVCFGWTTHPGTVKWRECIQALVVAQVSLDHSLVDRVREHLGRLGISEYWIIQTQKPMSRHTHVEEEMECDVTFSGNWRKATNDEIAEWTQRQYRECQTSAAHSSLSSSSSKRRRDATRQSQSSSHRRRRRHYTNHKRTRRMAPSPRDAQYPMIAKSVCLGWNRHPGTILWRTVVHAMAQDTHQYPEWKDSMGHVVKNELGKDNVAIYLVFRDEYDEACTSIHDGLWVHATTEEIVHATREEFERHRDHQRRNDRARAFNTKEMQGESLFPRNVGTGASGHSMPNGAMSEDSDCSDVTSSEDDGSRAPSNEEDSYESSEFDDDDDYDYPYDASVSPIVIDPPNEKGDTPVVPAPAAKPEPQTVVSSTEPVSTTSGTAMAGPKQKSASSPNAFRAANVDSTACRAQPSSPMPRSIDVKAQIRIAIGPQVDKKGAQNTTDGTVPDVGPTSMSETNGKSECFGWVKRLDTVESRQLEQRRENAIKNYFRFSPSCSDHTCNRMKRALEVWGIYDIGCIEDGGLVLEQAFEDQQFPDKWRRAMTEAITNSIQQNLVPDEKRFPAPKDLDAPNRDDCVKADTMKQLSTILRALANMRISSGPKLSHDNDEMLTKALPDVESSLSDANAKQGPGQATLPLTKPASTHMIEEVWSMSTLVNAVAGIQVDQEVRQALLTLVQAWDPTSKHELKESALSEVASSDASVTISPQLQHGDQVASSPETFRIKNVTVNRSDDIFPPRMDESSSVTEVQPEQQTSSLAPIQGNIASNISAETRAVTLGPLKHALLLNSHTEMWRKLLKENFSMKFDEYPTWTDDIVTKLRERLEKDGIHRFVVYVDDNDIPIDQILDCGTFRDASEKEIMERTKQYFAEDRLECFSNSSATRLKQPKHRPRRSETTRN